jgi:2-polyprenyl-3-methyl-5-hydroxy-6-metoxy-1,4-benzoquinol methylase
MTTINKTQKNCPLCGSVVKIRHPAQPGYRIGMTFEILHCEGCDTSYVYPMDVDSTIYDAIYAYSEKITGYDRYTKYSKGVLEVDDPLAYLSETEDVYWSIRSCLERIEPGAKILEIGSGLGYMTYALRKKGYDAFGIDISKVAVDNARIRYGSYFEEADLADWSTRKAGEYDMVLMAELIEHIPNPLEFLKMALNLLKSNGYLIVTTPNKSYFPPSMLWETDPPPVHLWWFSETSLRTLAKQLEFSIEFVDFTEFNQQFSTSHQSWIFLPEQPTQGARLDRQNYPLSREALRASQRNRRPSFYPLRKLKRSMVRGIQSLRNLYCRAKPSRVRGTLCAVMTKLTGVIEQEIPTSEIQ